MIGVSDGRQYEDELSMHIDHQLDPVSGPYNDQPTDEAKHREGNFIYQELKQKESEMEQQSQAGVPDYENLPPASQNISEDISHLPRITVTPRAPLKPIEEGNIDLNNR